MLDLIFLQLINSTLSTSTFTSRMDFQMLNAQRRSFSPKHRAHRWIPSSKLTWQVIRPMCQSTGQQIRARPFVRVEQIIAILC